ncbi:hypothetical protein QUF63_01950 [Anaerolineales bacterium HSG25]|nr:hypothetical protein [Anaerolineales bacterium HSG25]
MPQETLGYYGLIELSDRDGYIGGLLVIDSTGKPLEFRVTHPIRPTVVQRGLYGSSLLSHLNEELCGLPLYNALKNKPDIILVQSVNQLSIGDKIDSQVVHIMSAKKSIKMFDSMENRYEMSASNNRFESVILTFPEPTDEDEQSTVIQHLNHFFKWVALLEPFDRITTAINALGEHDQRFR